MVDQVENNHMLCFCKGMYVHSEVVHIPNTFCQLNFVQFSNFLEINEFELVTYVSKNPLNRYSDRAHQFVEIFLQLSRMISSERACKWTLRITVNAQWKTCSWRERKLLQFIQKARIR